MVKRITMMIMMTMMMTVMTRCQEGDKRNSDIKDSTSAMWCNVPPTWIFINKINANVTQFNKICALLCPVGS